MTLTAPNPTDGSRAGRPRPGMAENDARARVSRIEIFPIKSLDAVRVEEAVITSGGILENDRVYAIVDADGAFVNSKRTAEINRIRSSFDPDFKGVRLWRQGEAPVRFDLSERGPLDRWLSDHFGFRVTVKHEPLKGFPDDSDAYGPTITSVASLKRIQHWYPQLSLENTRRRFRTNVELDSDRAFVEDALFGAPGERKPFRIGELSLFGHNPCQRCVVPSRDPDTGEVFQGFQKTFAELRKRQLPEWADVRRFNHFYRFALNTSIPPTEAGKRLRVGDILVA
jgi:uncharacterized protein